MRIAMLGAGGVGGYFGALLARAGQAVTLYARGEHLRAMRRDGLTICSESESFTVPVSVTDDERELAGAELAILAVKSYSVGEIAPVVRRLALGGAVVLPLLNGVESAEILERHGVPRSQLLGGLTMVSAARTAPGVITRTSWREKIVLGELDGTLSERVTRITGAMESAGITAVASRDIVLELWRKFNMLCAMAAACGLSRTDVAGVRDANLGRLLIARAIAEIAAVARARGVKIAPTQESDAMRGIEAVPGEMKPSFLLDVERGGPNELDVLSGAVSRFGREVGVETPVHDTATAALGATHR